MTRFRDPTTYEQMYPATGSWIEKVDADAMENLAPEAEPLSPLKLRRQRLARLQKVDCSVIYESVRNELACMETFSEESANAIWKLQRKWREESAKIKRVDLLRARGHVFYKEAKAIARADRERFFGAQ